MREIKFRAEYQQKIYDVIAIFFDIQQVQLKRKNCLSIDYKNESGTTDVGLMKYLTFGLTWAPSYR